MRTQYDLSTLSWTLTGVMPHQWRFEKGMELGNTLKAEIPSVPACVPGSVQGTLRNAGVLPDWNVGLNARLCEWVEHRHWVYETTLPADWLLSEKTLTLQCLGLDYCTVIRLNGVEIGSSQGTFVPHEFDLTPYIIPGPNWLQIIFECAPNWLGQFGFTSQMTEWKARFNYGWDWTSRLVQIGIWDRVLLQVDDGEKFDQVSLRTDAEADSKTGILRLHGEITGKRGTQVRVQLSREGQPVDEWIVSRTQFQQGMTRSLSPIALWWPNGWGEQPTYQCTLDLLDADGQVLDSEVRTIGFRHLEWKPCLGAPVEADSWICVVNGQPLFLQGVNWTPIRPNFADVLEEDIRKRIQLYQELGCNILRVWGGACLETAEFYRICDELGLLVWQEFPLSSSGIDNWPPEDTQSIEALGTIATSYIYRRQHHVSLALWCGGNELQGGLDGSKMGIGKPVDCSHPLIARLQQTVQALDPERRFLASSSSGPRFGADPDEFGQGVHWDVHGPWNLSGTRAEWERYWLDDDALFRSEVGCPGASSLDIMEEYRGQYEITPCSLENPLWRRTSWWVEDEIFRTENGRDPESAEEYVTWSQTRQAWALATVARTAKSRFPAIGGVIFWMGHDSFPCTANTALVDFHGRPKPAALAVAEVFHSKR